MKTIKAVIGANFGDEGKGLMTDYFCSLKKPVLNVRFNGGAQAGHTVETPGGRRHVFHHIGAGSLSGQNSTYLSKHFIVNPILFRKEYTELINKCGNIPIIFVDGECRFTTPQDMMVNQIIENRRDKNRHGSCGAGIFETVNRCSSGKFYDLRVRHFRESTKLVMSTIANKYIPYAINRLKELGVSDLTKQEIDLLTNKEILNTYLSDIEFFMRNTVKVNQRILYSYSNIVFEGAQGLLLDRNNVEYFPHLTPSNTGMKNVVSILNNEDFEYDLEVCYVTRSYLTRHGAGKLNTECEKEYIGRDIVEKTNVTNEHQGGFRYGYFDTDLFLKSIKNDVIQVKNEATVSIAVTHLDETDNNIIIGDNKSISVDDFEIPVKYRSYGPTRNDIIIIGEDGM